MVIKRKIVCISLDPEAVLMKDKIEFELSFSEFIRDKIKEEYNKQKGIEV